jgi:hypothetical protein
MERNELKGKQTPGNIEAGSIQLSGHIYPYCTRVGNRQLAQTIHAGKYASKSNKLETKANATLYAEAHNVANQTGMWPMDLVERVKELEKVSNRLMEAAGWVRQYRREKNNPHLPKPLNSDVQAMWAELGKACEVVAKTLRPQLFPDLLTTKS